MKPSPVEADDVSINVTFSYERQLWRRAMTGWWQSVVPPAPFVQRAIFWAVVWIAIGALAGAVNIFGLSPYYVLAGLIGAGILVGVFAYLQRTRMSQFWNVIGTHWDQAGETRARFGPEGLTLTDNVSRRDLQWSAIDAIATVRGGTVLRSGISMTVVPDATLPDGLTGKAFRAQLSAWRGQG